MSEFMVSGDDVLVQSLADAYRGAYYFAYER